MENLEIKKYLPLILLTAFGYFVDTYDLLVSSVARVSSIVSLNLAHTEDMATIKEIGMSLENWQSIGLLIGGLFWGILGDKIGRKRVLYFSIFIYSLGTFFNGFLIAGIPNILLIYKLLRFLSGFGLAGELGIGITMISEVMNSKSRSYGSMIVVSFGILGCVFAAGLSMLKLLEWNQLFILGGSMGFILLFFRIKLTESSFYLKQQKSSISKGDFLAIISNKKLLSKFLICILIGLPCYFVVGLPVKFAPNFGAIFGISDVSIAVTIIVFYITVSISDIFANYLSQRLQSRKKVIYFFNIMSFISILLFCIVKPKSAFQYHFIFTPLLAFSVGYWALLVTITSETFGSNLRATATTSVPNFIRSMFIPISLIFLNLEKQFSSINAALMVGFICSLIALICTYLLKETYNKDLNFVE